MKVIQKIRDMLCSGLHSLLYSQNNYIKFNHSIRTAGIISSFLLCVLNLMAAFPIVNKTSTVEAAAGSPNPSTTILTMAANHTVANLTLTPHGSTATFSSSSESELAKFGITTNNYTGYTLSIAASDDNGLLTNTDSTITSNNTLDSIDTILDSATFDNNAYNGKWGYKPSKYNSADNISFRPAPTTTASTLDVTNAANNESNNYTIGLGARVGYDKPAGTYTNTFILATVANPISYSVTYNNDTTDTSVTNLPDQQSGAISIANLTLSSVIPSRTNYTFLNWCLGTTANNGTTCNGTTFESGAQFGIDQTIATNDYILNAVWSPDITIKTVTGISSVSLNGESCTSTSGCIIRGLANGQAYTLTAIPDTGYSFTSWDAGSYGSVVSTTSVATDYIVGGGPSIITPSAIVNKYTCTKQYRLQNGDGTWGNNYITDTTEQVDYGTTCSYSKSVTNYKGSETGANNTPATTSGTMGVDGLTLQVSLYRNTYTVTISNSNTTSNPSSSLTIRYGGSATVTVTPNSGYYLSSVSCPSGYSCTGYSTGASYTGSQTVTIANNNTTNNGTLSFAGMPSCSSAFPGGTMQAFSASGLCDSVTSGTLSDSRDNQNYTVAKINGNWWMTRNLAIGCNGSGSTYSDTVSRKSLTSSDSNVSTTWSTPSVSLTYGNSYYPSMVCNATYGAWYNYAAASAGTITGSSNTTEASYSICPKGWRLPNYSEIYGIKSYSSAFNPVTGGTYYDGSLGDTSIGRWWSSIAYANPARYSLDYSFGSLGVAGGDRSDGFYVRCIKA